MDQEPIKTEKKKAKGSYITGIIGAVIGGIIATIPWILVYVYGQMMFSILAALIAFGEYYGYKIARGKVNKKLPVILMVMALVIVSITTLVVIPGLLIHNEGIAVTTENIQRLYQNSEFSTAIVKDFVISFIFTILGASIVTSNVKRKLSNNEKDGKDSSKNTTQINEIQKAAIELLKPIFTKYEATTQEKAMLKEEVIAEVEDKRKAKYSFSYLKQLGIIKKYKGKFYYVEDAENNTIGSTKISKWQILSFAILVAIFMLFFTLSIITNKKAENAVYQDSNVQFEIQKDWTKGQSEYTTEWNFYKYISNKPVLNESNEITEGDYASYPAGINVYYDPSEQETISNIDDVKTNLEAGLENSTEKPETQEMTIEKTKNNYDVLKVKMVYNTEPKQVTYYYYILNGKKLSCITAYSFNLDEADALETEASNVANSFKWLQ